MQQTPKREYQLIFGYLMPNETKTFAWFLRQTFSQSEVLQLLDIDAQTLQNWANRGIIKPNVEAPGRQGKRLYAGEHLVAIAIIFDLSRLGVSPSMSTLQAIVLLQKSIEIVKARKLARRDGRSIKKSGIGNYVAMIVSGKENNIIFCLQKEVSSNLDPAHATLLIPCGQLINDLAARAHDLKQRAAAEADSTKVDAG